jgi:hypothetical protein
MANASDKSLDDLVRELEAGPAYDNAAEFPPGLVGDCSRFVMQTSRFPNAGLALASGLSACGKLCDRRFAGPTGSTTILYSTMIAPTGVGKQRPLEASKELLAVTFRSELIGPGDLASVQSVQSLICREPYSKLCVIDEFGLVLARAVADSNNVNASIARESNSLWGVGWSRYDSVERAHKEAEYVIGPAFAFLGATTPAELYEVLSAGLVGNGFINRLLVFPASAKSAEREPELSPDVPPTALSNELRRLATWHGGPNTPREGDTRLTPVLRMKWGPGAEMIYRKLSEEMSAGRNQRELDLQQRVPEYAVRVATIIAAGRFSESVQQVDIQWGERIARASLAEVRKGLDKYAPTLEFGKLCDELHAAFTVSPWISLRDLKKRFGRRAKFKSLLDDALRQLVEEDTIAHDNRAPPLGGPVSVGYRLKTDE